MRTDQEFQQLLDDGLKHREDVKTLEDRKKAIDKDIIAHLFESEARYMTEDGGFKVQEDRGSWAIGSKVTKTTDTAALRAALIVSGVEIAIVDAAIDLSTKTSVSDPFLVFYPKRESEEKGAKK